MIIVFAFYGSSANAQRLMENLDRGVVAVRNAEGKVFVSWRLLGNDPADISFNVNRANGNIIEGSDKTIKLNKEPITKTTNFLDASADTAVMYSYYIETLLKGKKSEAGKPFILKPGNLPYFSIPLQTPAGYSAGDGSVGHAIARKSGGDKYVGLVHRIAPDERQRIDGLHHLP